MSTPTSSAPAGSSSAAGAAVSAALPAPARGGQQAQRGIDPRWLSSSLLTLMLVVGQWQFQILGDSYVPWLVSLGTCLACELLLHRLATGRGVNLLSAYISGNSVAILLKPAGGLLWPYIVCAVFAILSKYVLRYRERHLWNPTNLSVCLMLLLAAPVTGMLSHEWGNDRSLDTLRMAWSALFAGAPAWSEVGRQFMSSPNMVMIIWPIGLLVVWRARVWHLTLGYLALFVLFAWVRTWFNGAPLLSELGPVTGPMYQLFMFFMVTDPRTIVSGRKQQMRVLLLIALLECAIRLAADFEWLGPDNPLRTAPPMFALFFVGPVALWWQLRRTPVRAPAPR